MNNFKRYTAQFLIVTVGMYVIIIFTNYIIDPYQQYRKASFYIFNSKAQRHLNAGLIKNYDYDSLLIGSSMAANFDAKEIENKLNFKKVIKPLTFGGFISEEAKTINFALKNRDIKNILLSIDFYSFSRYNTPLEKNRKFPLYLYDFDYLNDTNYLTDFRVFGRAIRSLKNRYDIAKVNNRLNTLYDWQEEYNNAFNNNHLLSDYLSKKNNSNEQYIYQFDIMKKNFDTYLFPIIKKNRNINYYFFYSPYSILNYKLAYEHNYLKEYIKFKEYIFQKLSSFKNIKLYDFQIDKEISHDLTKYKDINHYHKDINNLMLDKMKNNEYLVTKENYLVFSDKLISQIKNYKVE